MTPSQDEVVPPPDGPRRGHRTRRWIAVAVLGVALVVAVVILVNHVERAERMQDERDAAEQSAWDNRTEMDQVIIDTAARLGLTGAPREERETPLTCMRNDGRPGLSYLAHGCLLYTSDAADE